VVTQYFRLKYPDSRYSLGYLASPNIESHAKFFRLLEPEKSIEVRLTAGYPVEQSTNTGLVCQPRTQYFVVRSSGAGGSGVRKKRGKDR